MLLQSPMLQVQGPGAPATAPYTASRFSSIPSLLNLPFLPLTLAAGARINHDGGRFGRLASLSPQGGGPVGSLPYAGRTPQPRSATRPSGGPWGACGQGVFSAWFPLLCLEHLIGVAPPRYGVIPVRKNDYNHHGSASNPWHMSGCRCNRVSRPGPAPRVTTHTPLAPRRRGRARWRRVSPSRRP